MKGIGDNWKKTHLSKVRTVSPTYISNKSSGIFGSMAKLPGFYLNFVVFEAHPGDMPEIDKNRFFIHDFMGFV